MKTIKIKDFTFICTSKNTRSGLKHEAQMLINNSFVSEATQYWVNRTWESFTYQSVIRNCVQNHIAQIEYGIETDYRNENNVIRKTKKHSEKLNELFNQNAEIKEAKKILKLIETNIY